LRDATGIDWKERELWGRSFRRAGFFILFSPKFSFTKLHIRLTHSLRLTTPLLRLTHHSGFIRNRHPKFIREVPVLVVSAPALQGSDFEKL
jgi:hypothetical protein